MGTATRKLGDSPKKQSWLVRNEQGETFGPVDFETLKAWACDGRLAPTNEVSENGADWQLATANRSLEMNWVAEVTPGTFYGPIHRRAMEDLVRDGSIASASAFFERLSLGGKAEAVPDEAQAERVRALTEQYAQIQQQLAAAESQLREAKRLASEREDQVREAKRQVADCEAQLQASKSRSAEMEAHVRQAQSQAEQAQSQAEQAQSQAEQAQSQAEQARQQAESGERQLRVQLAEHDAQAQRRIAAYEEQVRLAQQQAGAYAEQMEQVRQQAAAVEAHLRATVQQVSEQAEQARLAQQQWMSKADGLAGELEALRKTHAEGLAKAAEMNAAHAAERAGCDARERALASERQALADSLAQARAERDEQKVRLARLEAEHQGALKAGSECGELDVRLRTVCAELAGVQQALACERDAAQQAEARCAALEAALQAAQARTGESAALSEGVSAELRQLRGQIEALSAQFRQEREEREASARRDARPAERPVERVYVEAEPVEVLPPEGRGKGKSAPAAEPVRAAPEAPKKPSDPPKNAAGGRPGAGLSLAELEQQARRELERLGAQGANLFKRNK